MSITLKNFTEATGKRFRMTKGQKERGLSREEAFNEIHKPKENIPEAIEGNTKLLPEIEEDTSRLPKKPLWKPRSSITNEDRCYWPKCKRKHASDLVFYGYPINSEHMSEHSMSWIHASLGKKNKGCICRYCKKTS
jgi:hypothetical protein